MGSKFEVPGWVLLTASLSGVGALAASYWLGSPAAGGAVAILHWLGLGLAAASIAGGLGSHRARRRREEALATANAVLTQTGRGQHRILEAATEGVVVLDARDRVEFLNATAERLTGWTRAMAAGRPVEEVLKLVAADAGPAGSADPVSALLTRTVAEAGPFRLEARGGAASPVSVRTVVLADEPGSGRAVVLRDRSAEEAARRRWVESERRLGTLAVILPGMAYRCRNDAERSLEFVSEGARGLTGQAPETLLATAPGGHARLVHPDDRARVQHELAVALQEGRSYQITYRLVGEGHPERLVCDYGCGVPGPAGTPEALQGFVMDITERQAAERALAESERKYRDLVENAGEGIFVAQDGRFAFANRKTEAVLGVDRAELRARSFTDFIHEEDRALVAGRHARRLGGQAEPESYAFRLVTGSGDVRWIELRTIAVTWHGRPATLNYARDITDRKRAEAALSEAENRYRHLFENAPIAYQSLDREARILDVNRAWLELLGYQREEVIGLPVAEFLAPEARGALPERFEAFVASGRLEHVEMELMRADGGRVTVVAEGRIARDAGGGFLQTHCMLYDISDRKRADEALRRSEEGFRKLFDATEEAILITEADTGRIRDANAAAVRLFGCATREALLAREFAGILEPLVPGAGGAAGDWIRRAREEGRCTIECVARRADGTACCVEFFLRPFEISAGKSLLVVGHDITARRETEAALRDSERLLERTGQMARVGGWEVDLVTRRVRWSAQTRRIHEVADDYEPAAESWPDFYDPAARAVVETAVRQGLAQGQAWDVEVPFTTARGRRLWVRVCGQADYEGGVAVRILGAFQDITARKEAEAQLRLQSTALEAADNAILITDPAGRIQWANRAFVERSGYSLAEAVGRNPRELIRSGEHPRAYFQNLWETILAGKVWRGGLVNRRKDGRLYREENTITPVRDERGAITHFIAIKQDVTERERNEAERDEMLHHIWEQTARMTRIMQCAPAAVALLAADGRVLLSNTRADEEFTGAADCLEDNRLVRLGDHSLADLLRPPVAHVWHEVHVGERTLEAVATPVDMDATTPSGWVLVFHDVTAAREVRRALERHERLSAIGQLAAGIAHDFNNIAQVIVLHVQLLKSSPRLSPGDQDHLVAINNKAMQASTMIQQILDFSRRTSLERQVVDLVALCREEAALLRRTLPGRITITFDHDGTDCRVDADANRLRQVLMNLAFNARDAMPSGGELRLGLARLEVGPGRPAPAAGLPSGHWVRLVVADSGSGMSPEVQKHLFEPFYTTKPPGKGTGLGLAQVHGIVTQHGGHIHVSSQPQSGTTFTLFFPVAEVVSAPRPVAPPAPEPPSVSTILVVEDDATVRGVLLQILAGMGHRCLEAGDGLQALAQLHSPEGARVDLVLSDWRMPGMDGAGLFRALRAEGNPVPMILLSGFACNDALHPLLAEGLAGWLPKPLDLPRLAALIARTLAQRREALSKT